MNVAAHLYICLLVGSSMHLRPSGILLGHKDILGSPRSDLCRSYKAQERWADIGGTIKLSTIFSSWKLIKVDRPCIQPVSGTKKSTV